MPPVLAPGDQCDRYGIVAFLGTSGAAERYLARGPSGEPCVLKIMASPGADKQRLRFAQEGVVLAKIAHANVVRVFGAGALGERVWLAIERFGDHTLGDLLRSGGTPPLDDLLGWVQQVCAGLAEAHRLGIVHRNLTPESVVLGPGGVAKLGELGMAKLSSFGVVTTEDQQIGAALYAAPEQLVGEEEAGPRADLYGLGVLLYEAIAGVLPMGPGQLNVMMAVTWHLSERARPLREHAAARGVPADLEALVHQMLEKTPSLRPVSALEVHDRLREVRVSLRAPLLREMRNAAPVPHSISLAPTQPMAAIPPGHVSTHPPDPGPAGGDRPAVLPVPVAPPPTHPTPIPAAQLVAMGETPIPPAQPVPAAALPPLGAPRIVACPAPYPPAAPGEVRVTGEPVERDAPRSRPVSRRAAGAAIGAGVLAFAAAAATATWTLWSHGPGPAPGAGSDTTAMPAPAPAPPRSPDAGAPKHRSRAR